MRIGELARRTGCTPRALRYYEQQGLLSADRGPNGYREYGEHAVNVAVNLKQLFAAGLTTEDIRPYRALLTCQYDQLTGDDEALAVVDRRIASLDERIATLQDVRDRLTELATELRRRRRAHVHTAA